MKQNLNFQRFRGGGEGWENDTCISKILLADDRNCVAVIFIC